MKKLILTVCNGNIHRSVIAEICLNRELKKCGLGDEIVCISRGLEKREGKCRMMDFPEEWALTKPVLDELGIVVPEDRTAQQIDSAIIEDSSVILAMDRRVLNLLKKSFPLCYYKMICLFSVLAVGTANEKIVGGNILDLKGVTDSELHRQTNQLIYSISTSTYSVRILHYLLDLVNPGRVKIIYCANCANKDLPKHIRDRIESDRRDLS